MICSKKFSNTPSTILRTMNVPRKAGANHPLVEKIGALQRAIRRNETPPHKEYWTVGSSVPKSGFLGRVSCNVVSPIGKFHSTIANFYCHDSILRKAVYSLQTQGKLCFSVFSRGKESGNESLSVWNQVPNLLTSFSVRVSCGFFGATSRCSCRIRAGFSFIGACLRENVDSSVSLVTRSIDPLSE